jgi:S-adenosylmethionine synthetase
MELVIEEGGRATAERRFEIVERKGLGHPDSMCDSIMEAAARTLANEYVEHFGQVQHFNLDKALLASGKSSPRFGGGTVDEPMRFVFGDRAMSDVAGHRIPVADLVEETARAWLRAHLRFVDPERHIVFQSELGEGSAELVGLYDADAPRANDTSIGVGVAPTTETERLVLETESFLNDDAFKNRFPETGEDVKVMGVRRGQRLDLTVALAFVDRFIADEAAYFGKKREVEDELTAHLYSRLEQLDQLAIRINTLDSPGRGEDGAYLTVTGTSAESADSGEVGRGNSLLGFTSVTRPASGEAVAGKNPLCHVGKIYNHLAQRAADRIAALEAVAEASTFLVSEIGARLDEPQFVSVNLVLRPEAHLSEVRPDIEAIFSQTLAEAPHFATDWLRGTTPQFSS